ncbi:MAG: ATP-binding protein [Clostridia bacterium]
MLARELYMKQIRPFINTDLIKVVTGIRRSGKSVMLELIKNELVGMGVTPKQMISINFEDIEYKGLTDSDSLHAYVSDMIGDSKVKTYLFLDEIQEVNEWEKCLNSFRVKFEIDIYVTGSNAKLLSGELATYLAGRFVQFVVYPFSFLEFSEIFLVTNPDISSSELFKKYLILGGMPFLANLNFQEAPCMQYLQDVYSSVVLKDITSRNRIRDVDLLERIIRYLIANIGKTFSATSISKYFKSERRSVSPETILNYIRACADAYLFFRASRQDLPGKKLLTINEKYYLADHGIREAIFGGNGRDIEIVLENIVFIELLRRGYSVTVGKIRGLEIDFVAEKGDHRLYIQVAYLLASESTVEREFGALMALEDNYEKYVLTMDELNMSREGIVHMNIREFLTKY